MTKLILFLAAFCIFNFQVIAEDNSSARGVKKEETQAETEDKKVETVEKKEEQPEFTPRKWFFGASASLLNFSAPLADLEEIDYDIDTSLWTTLSGSYRFRKGLSFVGNISIDSKDIKKGLDVLGQFSTENYIIQFTSGKFTGKASVTSQIINSSFTQTKDDVSTKYLAIDLLFSRPRSWGCDGCIPGIRYIQYEIPAALGVGSDVINGSFSGSGSVLDPALGVKGILGVMSFGTQRDYVLGNDGNQLEKSALAQGFAKGMTQVAKLGHTIGIDGHVGIGLGVAKASDEGKANAAAVTSGRTLEDDTRTLILYELSLGFLWAYNGVIGADGRWSAGLGYSYRLNSAFSSLNQDDPSSSDQLNFQDVSLGYGHHGPIANLYMAF